jgi:hypothetical protein
MPTEMNYANASNIAGALTAAVVTKPTVLCTDDKGIKNGSGATVDALTGAALLTTIDCTPLAKPGATPTKVDCSSSVHADARPACLTTLAADITSARTSTFFTGNTLRGLLLTAYAWDTMGNIAGISAILLYIAGAILLIMSIVGFWHASRQPKGTGIVNGGKATTAASTK